MNYNHIVTFINHFHQTEARIKVQPWDVLSRDQMFRLRRRICPMKGSVKCECRDFTQLIDKDNMLKIIHHVQEAAPFRKSWIVVPIDYKGEIKTHAE